mmetsp:Transcript_5386/g.13030  ORF Transcript_5386/g.13030 Transcript_5386/m.13030 type:complete len:228 (+) Transcript_5386:124-807(+)
MYLSSLTRCAGFVTRSASSTSCSVTGPSRTLDPSCSPSIASNCFMMRLSGRMAASLQRRTISLPENPSVRADTAAQSTPGARSGVRCLEAIASRAPGPGRGTKMRFSRRRRSAESRSQGRLDAQSRNTWSSDEMTPSSWMSSSVFMRRLPSCSCPAERRWDIMASISSRKIVDGLWYRASSNSTRTSFSESPRHLETMLDAEMLKKVVLHSVATALASIVFPVPGGP